jgi:hypothetical protein
MHENEALEYAKSYLKKATESKLGSPELFQHFNSFLIYSRAVIQRAEKEAKPKGRKPDWFDPVCKEPLIKFFGTLRNVGLKEFAIRPAMAIEATLTEHVGISDSLSYELIDTKTGVVLQRGSSSPTAKKNSSLVDKPRIRETAFFTGPIVETFVDAKNTDVFKLSERYLARLEAFVAEGQELGILTPPSRESES